MNTWQTYLEANDQNFIQEYLEFLRIPSIMSEPERAGDVQLAAEWVADKLKAIGLENVAIMKSEAMLHSVVYADWLHAEGQPTVLVYAHYDVQPVNPDLWDSPPFEPRLEDELVYARGAADCKGALLLPVYAVEALLATDKALPVNVKFLFEGQEEIGSPGLKEMVIENQEKFACDFAYNADAMQYSDTEPQIWLSTRGACALDIQVEGPQQNQHSGDWGGAIQNPVHALSRIIASLHTEDGAVNVAGFYDEVVFTAEMRAQMAAIPYDAAGEKARIGIKEYFGEAGYTTLERRWVRPTLEITGMWGGYTQVEGFAAIVPNEARAKILCRLVHDQDHEEVAAQIKAHVESHSPPGVTVTTNILPVGGKAFNISADHPAVRPAVAVLEEIYGQPPYFTRIGGGVGILNLVRDYLGTSMVSFGFQRGDENFHGPNEFMRLSDFRKGQVAYAKLFAQISTSQ